MRGKLSTITNKFYILFGILNCTYFLVCLAAFKMIVNFTPFFLLIGIIFILFGMLKNKLNEESGYKKFRTASKVFETLLLIIVISFVFIEGCIAFGATVNHNKKPDYIVVLGCGLSGKNMLLPMYQRAQTALAYIKKNTDVKIVVSGGQGSGESISEAEAYKTYFVNNGVKADNIIEENKSTTTMQNMRYTADILRKTDGRKNLRVAVITSNYHVFRAKFLARRCGFNAEGVAAPVTELLLPNFSIREYFGIIKSFFLDR